MNKKVLNKRSLRQMSEYLDSLIKRAVCAGMDAHRIENEIKELNDMLKALDFSEQACDTDSDSTPSS